MGVDEHSYLCPVDERLYRGDKGDVPYPRPCVTYLLVRWHARRGFSGTKLAPPAGAPIAQNRFKDERMPPGKGRHLSTETIEKIKALLATTDLSTGQIAARMDCSTSAVASINKKYPIRVYGKNKHRWKVNEGFQRKS